ncbi:MAG: hypothetical protein WC001_00145 [Desulfurivibrionaceae bacterium]
MAVSPQKRPDSYRYRATAIVIFRHLLYIERLTPKGHKFRLRRQAAQLSYTRADAPHPHDDRRKTHSAFFIAAKEKS